MDTSILPRKRIYKKKPCPNCGAPINVQCARCRDCYNASMRKPKSDLHDFAKKYGFLWVGEKLDKAGDVTEWQCPNGHKWTATYYRISYGHGCPHCRSVQPEDYHAIAKERGFLWTGEHQKSNQTPTEWQCAEGHKWKANYHNIRQGSNCPVCAKVRQQDYHALAKERGFLWIGEFPKTTDYPTEWQCANGHKWSKSYGCIRDGHLCPLCWRIQSEDCHAIAEKRGFIWIGEKPKNSHSPTKWQCASGHKWIADYGSIRDGSGCPGCRNYVNSIRLSKQQQAIYDMVGGTLNHKVGKLSVDVALQLPMTNIGIEYDCFYWHGNYEERDAKRTERLIRAGWKVLAVKARIAVPTLEQLQDAIFTLLHGEDYVEIIMPDWGTGNKIRHNPRKGPPTD